MPAHRAAVARVLGSPRLHRTVVTGEVISKETAGEYALDVFGDRWSGCWGRRWLIGVGGGSRLGAW